MAEAAVDTEGAEKMDGKRKAAERVAAKNKRFNLDLGHLVMRKN